MGTTKGKKSDLRCIIFMRHGIAVNRDEFEGEEHARPLTEKGIEKTRRVAKSMASVLCPDLIVASDYRRARETAEICVEAFAKHRETPVSIIEAPALRPNEGYGVWMNSLDRICLDYPTCKSILVVGHQPNLSLLLARMVGAAPESLPFKKAGIAIIEHQETSSWQLAAFIPPKFWS